MNQQTKISTYEILLHLGRNVETGNRRNCRVTCVQRPLLATIDLKRMLSEFTRRSRTLNVTLVITKHTLVTI